MERENVPPDVDQQQLPQAQHSRIPVNHGFLPPQHHPDGSGQPMFISPPPVQVPPSVDPVIAQFMHMMQQQQQQHQQLMAQFLQRQQQKDEQQQAFFRDVVSSINVQVPSNPEQILDSLASNIKEFRYEADSAVTFSAWYSRYDDLFEKDAARLDDEAKVRLLLRKLGTAEHERYVSFILPTLPREHSFADTVAKMKGLFGAKESVISRRYKTLQIAKHPTEDHIAYACRINKSCVEFELGKLSEEQFKCLMFVCGLKSECDAEARTRLLSKIEENNDVTLEQLSNECQRILNLKHDNAMIESASSDQVNVIKQRFSGSRFNKQDRLPIKPPEREMKKQPETPCWFCGSFHYVRDCTYKTYKCSDCGKIGHREGYCDSARRSPRGRGNSAVATKVVVVNACSVQKRRRFVSVALNGTQVQLQLDTASDITVISRQVWSNIGGPVLSSASVKAKTASGNYLPLVGEFRCEVTIGETSRVCVVYVTDKQLQLLGSDLVDSFGLWSSPMDTFCSQITGSPTTSATLKAMFPKVFSEELGLCNKTKLKLEVREQARPIFCAKRPVAYAMQDAVDQELNRLEKLNIVTPVDYSEWAAPIVVVRKANGNIRICGDYSTGLNSALRSHQYPLPLPEDIFAKLANCKIFSQIDLSDAFLQVEVDEQFRHLLTINTHRGLYHYNRLPPGVKVAPGAFQQLIDTMLAGLNGASGYLDDVIVGGETQDDHDRNLKAVLQRIQEFGFTIRAEKCSFGKQQVRYLGYIIDRCGLRPDPAKIQAIVSLPAPTDVSGVRSFLGAINFYGKFVPNMRQLRYPLDNLLKNETKFRWSTECQQAFERFKQILSSDLLLTHYDPKQEIIVSADASSIGLGATLSHKFPDGSIKVVQHASRALTKAEQNYSQPDREGLAIIFAVTKFHKMIFGRHFRLQTDHAPLLRIFGSKKGIPVYTANRLQRFALNLLLYDFDIEYIPTDKFGNTDVLSRLINQHDKPEEDYIIACINLEQDVRSVVTDTINILPLSFRVVAQSTQADPLLRQVYRYVKDGWPVSKIVQAGIKRFQARKESLTVVDGCILFADRLVIPEQHQKQCLNQLHRGHPGVQRMKAIARSYVYWPSIDEDVIGYVKACQHCASVARSPPHAAPVPWQKTSGPWQRVHVDFAGPIEGDYYLIAVDSLSKWPEVIQTRRISSIATISILRGIFARLGMPVTLVTDNGSQFTSAEFANFCTINGIEHITTAPYHPQSNGQAERFVDTFKRSVKKIREGRKTMEEALDTFLLTYRSTPNRCVAENKSPAEILFGRKIRTDLELLRPPSVRATNDNNNRIDNQRSFNRNEAVYAKVYNKNSWRWSPGVVVEKIGDVMYNVWIEGRRLIRSHINQLRCRVLDGTASTIFEGSQTKELQQPFPLDIVLAPSVSPKPTEATHVNLPAADSTQCSRSSATLQPTTPLGKSSTPQRRPSSDTISNLSPALMSSASSSLAKSSEFESAVEMEPVATLPRRSSRIRKTPQWFDPYHLY
ncbi:uncharacterized protein K02A2.6-like [Sabethes cyaneus]|uniref:uncharacterized protein K02A2.6-like n=1 Tax=Sabethes cyaneus TaxID=53552 RepID=UPI00237E52FC|nr:uncharacterized protein K02A2.6-like [Sabethes cyaneus]